MHRILITTFLASISASTLAGQFSCSGNVNSVGITPQKGLLVADYGHGIHYLCNFNDAFNGISPATCSVWYNMLLTAKMKEKSIRMYYSDSAETNCKTLGNWTAPTPLPYYVVIE